LRHVEEAHARFPDDPIALANLADALVAAGQGERAAGVVEAALARTPGAARPHNGLGWHHLTRTVVLVTGLKVEGDGEALLACAGLAERAGDDAALGDYRARARDYRGFAPFVAPASGALARAGGATFRSSVVTSPALIRTPSPVLVDNTLAR
jgi:hypothetical protein